MIINCTKEINIQNLKFKNNKKSLWGMKRIVVADTLVELSPQSRSTHNLDLWGACQGCHEPQAVAVVGGYLD